MNRLIFTEEDFGFLKSHLLASQLESCAVLIADPIRSPRRTRYVVQEIHVAPQDAYTKRNTTRAILDPAFIAPLAKSAIATGRSLVFVHTHPFEEGQPLFSEIDDQGENLLLAFLTRRGSLQQHVALLLGPTGSRSRLLGTDDTVTVISIGPNRVLSNDEVVSQPAPRHDRQIRLLGSKGNSQLKSLSVGIVGLGGTGSVVCQQLAYLGVGALTLVDMDSVDESNLNRLIGASRRHLSLPKVQVARGNVGLINGDVAVTERLGNVIDNDVAASLLDVDFIFCCTDSQASRAVVNHLAYQFLIPAIDIGVSVSTTSGQVARITGRVQLLSAGRACLTCQDMLDPQEVRREFMSDAERAADPYFVGRGEPQPAVVSLNSAVSSLAVTMFLAVMAGLRSDARHLTYDAVQGRVRPATAAQVPGCIVCSRSGALGKASRWVLPVRNRTSNGTPE